MSDEAFRVRLAVNFNTFYIYIVAAHIGRFDCEGVSVGQMHFNLLEEGSAYFVTSAHRIDRIKSHCAHHVPGRHLTQILVATQPGWSVEIQLVHYLGSIFSCFPWLSYLVKQVDHMVRWFIAVGLLADHAGGEDGV